MASSLQIPVSVTLIPKPFVLPPVGRGPPLLQQHGDRHRSGGGSVGRLGAGDHGHRHGLAGVQHVLRGHLHVPGGPLQAGDAGAGVLHRRLKTRVLGGRRVEDLWRCTTCTARENALLIVCQPPSIGTSVND